MRNKSHKEERDEKLLGERDGQRRVPVLKLTEGKN
jgi:hypothetical protein